MAETHIDNDPDIQSALPDGQDQTPPREPRSGDGSNKPLDVVNFDSGTVLDDLFKQKTEEADAAEKAKADADAKAKADAGAKVKADADAKAKADADAKAGKKADADPKVKADADAKAKADADKAKADADAKAKADADKNKTDVLDSVELPPQAKARSGEAFAKVKAIAREEIKKREDQIKEHADKLAKTETDLSTARKELEKRPTVDPNTEKELTELRNWRKQIDVEADPKWKEFDTKVERNRESILAKLGEFGMKKAEIDEARRLKLDIDWDIILPKLPSQARRFIEAKLVENETLDNDKKESIKVAKTKADEFLKERATTSEAQVKEAVKVEQEVINHFLGQLPWSQKQEVKADAPAEQKAQIEAANKFADETQTRLKQLMDDRSPQSRAQMIVGTLLAYKLTAQLEAKEKEVAATKAAHDAELVKIKEELATATEELERVKKASGAGRKPSSAPATVTASTGQLIRSGADALDQLRHEVTAD